MALPSLAMATEAPMLLVRNYDLNSLVFLLYKMKNPFVIISNRSLYTCVSYGYRLLTGIFERNDSFLILLFQKHNF